MSNTKTGASEMTRQVLRDAKGEPMRLVEIRDQIAANGIDTSGGTVSSTLTSARKDHARYGIVRLGSGFWAYRPDTPEDDIGPSTTPTRPARPVAGPTTGEVLERFSDGIDDGPYKGAGLTPIAHTRDGDRICVDDQGAAWIVVVEARARLL